MKTPGIVIAGTNSGCGKTTLSMGVMAALKKKGLKVQPFKVGPDYIDPMFHTFITGRPSCNLDSWILPHETVKHLYNTHAQDADIAVTEGVMGFYDGHGVTSLSGSTAEVADLIGAPVVLVLNAEAMSLSAAAMVKGFCDLSPQARVRGVILNRVSGEVHYQLMKEAIERYTEVKVLGYLKNMKEAALESRHLGLVTSSEIHDLQHQVDQLAEEVASTVDLEGLLHLAKEAAPVQCTAPVLPDPIPGKVRIGVAKDKAFCFYYQDNLDLLTSLGGELVSFSPLTDAALPENLQGLYLGGGYPEVWAAALERNQTMKQAVQAHVQKGLPVYAECGGMMYLMERLRTGEGTTHAMAGVLPGSSHITSSLQRFGYVTVKTQKDTILAGAGQQIRAHEFHYSDVKVPDDTQRAYQVMKHRNGQVSRQWQCGYQVQRVLGGYPHLHFWANPHFAKGFLESCALAGEEETQ